MTGGPLSRRTFGQVLAAVVCQAGMRRAAADMRSRSAVVARHGMVATSQPLATQIALDVLQTGGNAADAAIAASAALCVLEPINAGLGGDAVGLVQDAGSGEMFGLRATGREFLDPLAPQALGEGPPQIGVPGLVDGWVALHGRFGRKPLADLLTPTIQLADEGVPIAARTAAAWARASSRLGEDDAVSPWRPGGAAPAFGQVVPQPDLAATLRLVALRGRTPLYEGELASGLLAELNRGRDVPLEASVLQAPSAEWSAPLRVGYRGREIAALPDATATLQTLLMLRDYDAARLGHGSADSVHLLVEAFKLARSDAAATAARLDPATASLQRRQIDPNRAQAIAIGPREAASTGVVAIDADGNRCVLAVAMGDPFGSGRGPVGTGLLLKSSTAGRLPLAMLVSPPEQSSQPAVAVTVGGTNPQLIAAQLLTGLIDFDLPPQQAVDAARVQLDEGRTLLVEDGAVDARQLARRQHQSADGPASVMGTVQLVARQPVRRTLIGASDSRTDGAAAGY